MTRYPPGLYTKPARLPRHATPGRESDTVAGTVSVSPPLLKQSRLQLVHPLVVTGIPRKASPGVRHNDLHEPAAQV